MNKFTELRDKKIKWSTTIREWTKEHEKPNECVYCGSKENLTTEHILPRCCGGPDLPENAVRICKKCNSGKGGKRLYEWFGLGNKDKVPRIAEGKYLKLLYEMHEKNGTLVCDLSRLCTKCDLGETCKENKTEGKLSVLCLEGIFNGA